MINNPTGHLMMQKIIPHLWFDKEAKEAAELYTSIFPGSKIQNSVTLHNTPSGSPEIVSFELAGQSFQAISAGPLFKFNPSVSFHVRYKSKQEVDAVWHTLLQGGQVLMDLDSYPFSERYGWLQDKYGLSWQIDYVGEAGIKQVISPMIMFVGSVCGKAEQAVNFWSSVFSDGRFSRILRYGQGEEPDQAGTLSFGAFSLFGQGFETMDSAHEHAFQFNEAISFIVNCDDQAEIDHYWQKLSAVPEAEQCGWLKDKYGFSWQIVPRDMSRLLQSGSQEITDRVTQAFLVMKKLNLARLQAAYEGKLLD
jgi:predicted 3-demethylubiquinone-9 3-methyltransferase (glyoxalase superfamily)